MMGLGLKSFILSFLLLFILHFSFSSLFHPLFLCFECFLIHASYFSIIGSFIFKQSNWGLKTRGKCSYFCKNKISAFLLRIDSHQDDAVSSMHAQSTLNGELPSPLAVGAFIRFHLQHLSILQSNLNTWTAISFISLTIFSSFILFWSSFLITFPEIIQYIKQFLKSVFFFHIWKIIWIWLTW